jgi:hypothetical protein
MDKPVSTTVRESFNFSPTVETVIPPDTVSILKDAEPEEKCKPPEVTERPVTLTVIPPATVALLETYNPPELIVILELTNSPVS